MKNERLARVLKGVVLVVATVFLVCGPGYAAPTGRPSAESNSGNQPKEDQNHLSGITAHPSAFTPEMSFGEAVNILRNSTQPPLNIVVLWRDLAENADVHEDTPIGIDGVSGIPLRKHLELLLLSVSAGSTAEVGYAVENGVVLVATKDSLPNKMKTRVYDISDLVSEPANYRGIGAFGGMYGGGGYGMGGMGGMYGGYGMGGMGGYGMGGMGGYGMGGYGGMGGYVGRYGGGYGQPYGGGYGGGYGQPYGGGYYGGRSGYGGYSAYPYSTGGSYGFSRGGELANLIGSIYRPRRAAPQRYNRRAAPQRRNSRTRQRSR